MILSFHTTFRHVYVHSTAGLGGRIRIECATEGDRGSWIYRRAGKLIEVAAFLDRVERHGAADDFRCVALREAAALLVDGQPERARRILESLSDPTTVPDELSSGKAALGAWRPGKK